MPQAQKTLLAKTQQFQVYRIFVGTKIFFPVSIVDAMSQNQILQIVIFSVLFGIATAAIGEKGKIIIKALDAVSHVILKMVGYVMASGCTVWYIRQHIARCNGSAGAQKYFHFNAHYFLYFSIGIHIAESG